MKRLWPYLKEAGITEAGAVSFASCLPLLPCRAAARLPENAAAVIVCGFPYYIKIEGQRNLSRYAAVPDYHRVVMAVLEPLCARLSAEFPGDFVPFVDNSPIREVDAAARAGLGVVGRNSLLLNPAGAPGCFWGRWSPACLWPVQRAPPALAWAAANVSGPAPPDASRKRGLTPAAAFPPLPKRRGSSPQRRRPWSNKAACSGAVTNARRSAPITRRRRKRICPSFGRMSGPFCKKRISALM